MQKECIRGTVVLMKSDESKPKECICCPGHKSHIFQMFLKLDDGMVRNVDDWLYKKFDYKDLEGRRIQLTAELLPK